MPEELFYEGPEELYDPDRVVQELLAKEQEEVDEEYAKQRRADDPDAGLRTIGEILPEVMHEVDRRREKHHTLMKRRSGETHDEQGA